MQPLSRDFYDREADLVARDMLGTLLVYRTSGSLRIGRIVETEAYLGPHDLASHTSRGRTPRTATMFGPPGHAYVYLIYGMYHCLNAVTGPVDHGAAVLIRALEPLQEIDASTRGPGRLCRAMGIDRRLNGIDLLGDELFLAEPEIREPFTTLASPRIGVAYAGETWAAEPLRFQIQGNAYLSRR